MHIYFLATTNIRATIPTFSSPHKKSFAQKYFRLHSMSSTAYLLFFLCISLHACYARHLSPLNKMEEKSHFSIKSDEKNGLDSSPKLNEGHNKTETRLVGDSVKPRNRRSTNHHRVHKATENASHGSLQKSLVSVSWRVPHYNNKKPRQKHPGFDLDYSPPKTHPPHHN